jgi:hypothetical protein
MPDSLVDLESRRAAVQSQIAQLGDMRSGSITGTGGRCGNPNCHCQRAGCKTVIGSRCKQSGMFWTVRAANAILALRCCQISGRFEDYWEARRA